MKKVLLAMAVASMMLVGCKDDKVKQKNDSNDIRFATHMGISRATEVSTATLEKFKAYVQKPDATGSSWEDFFTAEVSKAQGATSWTYAPVKQWIPGKSLRFYGVAPADLTFNNNSGKITVDFTPKTNAKDQQDLIIAAQETGKVTPVMMNFQHALSQVMIKAKNTGAKYKVEVAAVRLTNFDEKGACEIALTGTDAKKRQYSWPTPSGAHKFFAAAENDGAVVTINPNTTTATALDFTQGGFMILPKDLSGAKWEPVAADPGKDLQESKARLTFAIRVTSADDGALLYPTDNTKFGWAAIGIDTNFEGGKKYVITLDFANGAGLQDPDEGGNTTPDPSSPDPTIPGGGIDPKPVDPATPVLNSNDIVFDVTVEEWEDAGETVINL